jgi:hypothetical protein
MPVCPLCESSQEVGDACDVCGRRFAPGAAAARSAPPAAAIPDLETTRHAPVAADPARLAELEPTAAAPVRAPAAEVTEGLEPTAHAAAGEVAADPVELEPTASAPIPGDPEPRRPMTCRYCGTPATGWERLCARCGMRLPLPRARSGGPAVAAAPRPCTDCGVPVSGDKCPGCGARQPLG